MENLGTFYMITNLDDFLNEIFKIEIPIESKPGLIRTWIKSENIWGYVPLNITNTRKEIMESYKVTEWEFYYMVPYWNYSKDSYDYIGLNKYIPGRDNVYYEKEKKVKANYVIKTKKIRHIFGKVNSK